MKKNMLYLLILFTLLLNANEKVTLQLKWFHQFQFAGYYAAKEKGFYEEVGLDVQIKERNLKYNNIDEVINGNAQYGIADAILILYRLKKHPVVIVSPIFKHSPSVFISLKKNNIPSVYELNDKAIEFANSLKENIEALKIEHDFSSVSSYITASMGLICKNASEIDVDEVYKQADNLLYEAKRNGRNQIKYN